MSPLLQLLHQNTVKIHLMTARSHNIFKNANPHLQHTSLEKHNNYFIPHFFLIYHKIIPKYGTFTPLSHFSYLSRQFCQKSAEACLPCSFLYFYQISWIAPSVNLLGVPLATLVLATGVIALLLSLVPFMGL
ncbi:MAG: ComEC/Rec2 family competence protein, partial [Selenomonadaceae bacterium]|nr:ComEC/Rec2 family competence protein [Selenomonadaceae bacterium]